MERTFKVHQRDTNHWDIYTDGKRVFKIRGYPGHITLIDTQATDKNPVLFVFETVSTAMAVVCDKLML